MNRWTTVGRLSKSIALISGIVFVFWAVSADAQVDTLRNQPRDLTFTGTQLDPYESESDTSGKIQWNAYVDAYYGAYSDTSSQGVYQKFPTVSPRNNAFGLNIAQVSARYLSRRFRGAMTVFIGDVARSAWSPEFNMIQEANAGFKLGKKLWLDAGFFRTNLGLESIQPRENMTLSIATTTYFEPYYHSGLKVTWQLLKQLTIQANVLNSFNGFVETNRNKAKGISFAFQPSKQISITYGNLYCIESKSPTNQNQERFYHNLYAVFKNKHLTIGAELNYGTQEHTVLQGSDHQAQMFSALLAFKYRFHYQFAAYGRGEYFSDPDEMLTGPVVDNFHHLVGLRIGGLTAGLEYKPIPNSYVRIEARWLQSRKDERIFNLNGNPSINRYELLSGIGVWF